jgi:hypothetical protein
MQAMKAEIKRWIEFDHKKDPILELWIELEASIWSDLGAG